MWQGWRDSNSQHTDLESQYYWLLHQCRTLNCSGTVILATRLENNERYFLRRYVPLCVLES